MRGFSRTLQRLWICLRDSRLRQEGPLGESSLPHWWRRARLKVLVHYGLACCSVDVSTIDFNNYNSGNDPEALGLSFPYSCYSNVAGASTCISCESGKYANYIGAFACCSATPASTSSTAPEPTTTTPDSMTSPASNYVHHPEYAFGSYVSIHFVKNLPSTDKIATAEERHIYTTPVQRWLRGWRSSDA
jgi:hypothetical protein